MSTQPNLEGRWAGLTPPYRTIVADPPWPYRTSRDGHWAIPKPDGQQHHRRVDQMGYSVLSIADLSALPVIALADAIGSHLYLWTTNAFMVEAHAVARAWGFEPKTILTWVKVGQADPEAVSMRTGYHFRGATEHIVFAVRGSLRLQTTEGLPTAYLWPRVGGHSVKPPAAFDLIEKASPGPYVELFARQPRFGWDSWGHGYEELGAAR